MLIGLVLILVGYLFVLFVLEISTIFSRSAAYDRLKVDGVTPTASVDIEITALGDAWKNQRDPSRGYGLQLKARCDELGEVTCILEYAWFEGGWWGCANGRKHAYNNGITPTVEKGLVFRVRGKYYSQINELRCTYYELPDENLGYKAS